jgi:hypothetical protein
MKRKRTYRPFPSFITTLSLKYKGDNQTTPFVKHLLHMKLTGTEITVMRRIQTLEKKRVYHSIFVVLD